MPSKSLPRTPEEIRSDEQSFAAAKRVLAGSERLPLNAEAWKVLRFILNPELGCDASITREAFEIRFGWNPGPHRYFLSLAPAVLSQFLEWAGVDSVQDELRVLLNPGRGPGVDFPARSPGARQLWLAVAPDLITFSVRSGPDDPAHLPWPARIELTPREKVYRDFSPPIACPHCRGAIPRTRQFSDGSLLCPHCARSFSQS